MKLYIPTTTLNFNNILSSETISPKAFYGIRGYGYKRWEPVAENCLENGILLYKKPFSFTRPANGLDDYPMLIEIEMDEDEVSEFEPCGDWGYKSRHSLSLTPVTTRFIFFSEKDKRIALSKSEASAETKLTRLYDGKLSVENYAEDMQKHEVLDWEKPDYKALEDDKRLNKIKGFAYGYVIGRMLSRTETDVIKLNARYSVRDIVASVISSGEGIATKEQEKIIGDELLMFDSLYISLLEKYGKEWADKFYSELEKPSSGYYSNRRKWLSYLMKSLSVKEKWEELQQWITTAITRTEEERAGDYSIFGVDERAEIAVAHGKLTNINSEVGYIDEYRMLVNEVFTSDKYNDKVSTFRMELANDVTDCVIEDYGDRWKDSEIRTYLNAMRHYVAGEAFTQPWTDCVLSSITAVIMKGEDWKGLFRFMVSKGMCDYRYAFGLYGALNGFANLTRDFTDILFASDDKQYVRNVYKEIHRQLTGVELNGAIPEVSRLLPENIRESKIGCEEVVGIVKSTLAEDKAWLKENGVNFAGRKNSEIVECALTEANGDRERLLGILIKEGVSKARCESLLKKLQGGVPSRKNTGKKGHSKVSEQTLFDAMKEPKNDNPYVGSFDYEHIEDILMGIKGMFPNLEDKTYTFMKDDLKWTLDPRYNKYSTVEERINRFCSNLHEGQTKSVSKNNKPMAWKNEAYKNLSIKAIYEYLKETYCK